MTAQDGLQRTRGLRDVTGEAVAVSVHGAVVGQVIQSGPRFRSETKQCKSHMAHAERNGALAGWQLSEAAELRPITCKKSSRSPSPWLFNTKTT